MASKPALEDLLDTVVVLRDGAGRRARFVVDHVGDQLAICSYVFRGRHLPPTHCTVGGAVELGAPVARGWLVITGRVQSLNGQDAVAVEIEDVDVIQRRHAYREEVVLPFLLRLDFTDPGRRGRTDNLSIGGFAARIQGTPIADDTEVLVTFEMPERDQVDVVCRKVAGDIPQRFEFVDLDRHLEDRIARLVRDAELAKRRARTIRE